MRKEGNLHSLALILTSLILFLFFVSSSASAFSNQSFLGKGPYAYITNSLNNTVSVIDTSNDTITATVPVGFLPQGVAVTPDAKKVYVTNELTNNVSVINAIDNSVMVTVDVGSGPSGVAVTSDGKKVYVANRDSDNVSVIDTTTDTVIATVNIGGEGWDSPLGIAVNPAGTEVYVTNYESANVSVIDSATNNVTVTVPVADGPCGVAVTPNGKQVFVATMSGNVSIINTAINNVTAIVPAGFSSFGVAVSPDGKKVYVANEGNPEIENNQVSKIAVKIPGNTVSVIDTATNNVIATVPLVSSPLVGPFALGQFIVAPSAIEPIFPVANFTTNVTKDHSSLSVLFTSLSKNTTEWFWDFGDGNNSTDQNPVHTYSAADNYSVTLTASNANGTDTKKSEIEVQNAPQRTPGEFNLLIFIILILYIFRKSI